MKKRVWRGRIREWLTSHPWVVVSFCLGAAFGALFCLPLVPYSLPDSSANILGAALGAGIAVFGAAWYTRNERLQGDRELALAVRLLIEPIPDAIEDLFEISTRPVDDMDTRLAFHEVGLNTLRKINAAIGDLDELKPYMTSFGAVNITFILDLTRTLKDLAEGVDTWWKAGVGFVLAEPDFREELEYNTSMVTSAVDWTRTM